MHQFSEIAAHSRHQTFRLLQCEPPTRRKAPLWAIQECKKMCKYMYMGNMSAMWVHSPCYLKACQLKNEQKTYISFGFFKWARKPYNMPKKYAEILCCLAAPNKTKSRALNCLLFLVASVCLLQFFALFIFEKILRCHEVWGIPPGSEFSAINRAPVLVFVGRCGKSFLLAMPDGVSYWAINIWLP